MRKAPAYVLSGCLAALPLIGCAGDYTARQAAAVAPTPMAETSGFYQAAPRVYATGPAMPVAILVFLPGADLVATDPALWEAQGFDIVKPPSVDISRLVADQQTALASLVASAQTLADTPIWLIGPSQAIAAAMPGIGNGVSGLVVTSGSSPVASCSESFTYYDPGNGAPPQVQVKRSGDCGTGLPGITERQPSVAPAIPAPSHNKPRIIEASAVSKNLPPDARIRRLAQLIKGVPSS